MKFSQRTLLLSVCVALATLPGSRSRSGDLTVVVRTSPADVTLTANADGTTAVDLTATARDHVGRIDDDTLPALPYRVVQVLLPEGSTFRAIEVGVSSWETVSGNGFRATAATRETVAGSPPQQAAPRLVDASESAFPGQAARYLGTGTWHGRRIASFAVFPLRVSGGTLSLAREIELTVRTAFAGDGEDDDQRLARPLRLSPSRAAGIRSQLDALVVNPETGATYPEFPGAVSPRGGFKPTIAPSLEGSPVEYVIVTTNALAASYQRLADWRTARGMPAVVRTTDWIEQNYRHGSDVQETIRTFIRDAYEKWGTAFFLLGGDTDQLPARYLHTTYYYGGTDIPADIYFEGLDGTWNANHNAKYGENPSDNPDIYAEVYVNRLPTSNVADVEVMIDKIISYETAVDPTYQDKLMYMAEVLFPTPWSPGMTIDEDGAAIADYLANKHVNATDMQVVRMFETYYLFAGSVPESRAAAIDSMNAGYDHIFHIGHGYRFNLHVGDANVTIPDADGLTNNNRFFNLFMLNCTANAFDFDCLGEHFLSNPSGGAVSAIGAANSAFATAATYYMDKYTELLFTDDEVRIGQTHADSRLARSPIALLGDNGDYWTHLIYASLSDPALQMFNGPNQVLAVSHPDTIATGVSAFDVTVTAGGSPADSAVVCLWKGTEDYQVAQTNGLGVASFTFTCESPGSVSVVVTGLNSGAHTSTIWAVPTAGAYLTFAGATVDDDSLGGTFGNGDGVIDAGETVDLTPQTTNTGNAPSLSAVMVLSTSSGLVSVVDPVASVGAAGVGQTVAASDAWRITVSVSAQDESVSEFDVATTDGVGNWADGFARILHAPMLEFTTTRVDDSILGNDDGIIQDLEQFHLYRTLKNYGTGAAYGLHAILTDASGGGVNVLAGTAGYPNLGPFAEAEGAAGFVASEVSTLTENTIAIVVTDRFGRSVSDTFELRAPEPPTNLSFDASLGQDRIKVAWDAGLSTDVDRYHVYRSPTPGGPFTRASNDAVSNSVFTDTGLNANTRYYYVVTAIDTSGNESVPSDESSASTNPQQALGWPNVLADPTANSPIVGDIDGDNDLEVIIGNDFLYAWHHDGQEVRDGDGEALTHGVFSDQGAGYIGPAALAKIDSDFGLDIVAASWSTREVYVFNRTGAVLPGWPKPTIGKVRASMVVGDIDGDGDPEIITVDEEAYLYVWHSNGTEYRDGDSNPSTDGVFYRLPDTPWWQYQSPCAADLDHDNKDEIIIGTQDSKVYIFNEDGSALTGWPRTLSSFAGGGIAVGDIDNNGDLDIVVPTRNTGEVMALRPDNTILWIRWFPQNLFFNPSPALADVDDNGTLETFLPASNGLLYCIASNGANQPGWPVTYSSTTYTESSPVICDVTGDGFVDILLGDEGKYINGWDRAGQPLDGFPLVTQDAMRGTPAVADLDHDGTVEIIAGGYDRTVYVWDLTAPYNGARAPWPMKGANWHRNGLIGFLVPTAAPDVAFTHEVRGDRLLAWWNVPLELGSRFDVDRATVTAGTRGAFVRAATAVYSVGGRVEVTDDSVKMGETYVYRLMPEDGGEGFLSAEVRIPVARAAMEQNYPNPFNPTTTIVYYVPDVTGASAPVSLTVYDVTGARVRRLVDADVAPGRYALTWDGTNDTGDRVGSGVYFYRVVQPGFTATKKMVLLK